ncbi:hypothetical protein [Candidatus Nitrososphaera sp. FF02]|uniref:hypothetical protein n=1 Tax=Candidatus Nitrososphaera sp. FF02 TaxID=3398226 RepID=UPI0039EB9BDD
MDKGVRLAIMGLVVALAVVSSLFAAYATNTMMMVARTDIGSENLESDTAVSDADSEPSLLLVQHADSGTIEEENDASTSAIYKLTLNGVSTNVMYFSDRPERIVSQMTTQLYVDGWNEGQDSFAADPPNAALVMNKDEGENIIVVELLNPVYDSETQTLVYDVVSLNPPDGQGVLSFVPTTEGDDADIPSTFEQATLFIDNVHLNPHLPNPPPPPPPTPVTPPPSDVYGEVPPSIPSGHDDEYNNGYVQGYHDGRDDCLVNDSYDDSGLGINQSYDDGYKDGYRDGYNSSKEGIVDCHNRMQ